MNTIARLFVLLGRADLGPRHSPGWATAALFLSFSNAPGAFARKRAKAMQAGLPCRVRSLSLLGSPGGQVLDVVAAPYSEGRSRSLSIEGNAAGHLFLCLSSAFACGWRLSFVAGLRGRCVRHGNYHDERTLRCPPKKQWNPR